MRLDSAFGLYFLAPVAARDRPTVVGAGIVAQKQAVATVGTGYPGSRSRPLLPFPNGSAPYVDFLGRFVDHVGSPFWLSAIAGIAFYAFACGRRVKSAEPAFWAMLLVGSCIDRHTVDLSGIVSPQGWALWLIAVVQTILGRIRLDSRSMFVAIMAAVAACRADFLIDAGPLVERVAVHLAGSSPDPGGGVSTTGLHAGCGTEGVLLS